MIKLFRYYLYGIALVMSFALCGDVHKHGCFLSSGLSNFSYKIWNDDTSNDQFSDYFVSLGYSRIDLNGVRTGFGLMYLTQIYTPIDEDYAYNQDIIALNLISFLNKSIIDKNFFQLSAGFKSYYNLGGSYNNIAIGPTLGVSIKGISLEYFKGCMDLVDFSLYTDEISISANIKLGNND